MNFAINLTFANFSGNQLSVLRAEINYDYFFCCFHVFYIYKCKPNIANITFFYFIVRVYMNSSSTWRIAEMIIKIPIQIIRTFNSKIQFYFFVSLIQLLKYSVNLLNNYNIHHGINFYFQSKY